MTRENPGSLSLVDRLRMRPDSDCREAADRIEELEAALREVRSQAGHLEYTWRMTFLDLIDTALAAEEGNNG